jgi:hypothetical protein
MTKNITKVINEKEKMMLETARVSDPDPYPDPHGSALI